LKKRVLFIVVEAIKWSEDTNCLWLFVVVVLAPRLLVESHLAKSHLPEKHLAQKTLQANTKFGQLYI
jgi:hypothetical protein